MITLEEAQQALERALERQYERECGNDMYYSSRQYREDKEEIKFWEAKIKELSN